jgi:hypothetical protein
MITAVREALTPVPADGEPIWDKDAKQLFIGDGATAGGISVYDGVLATEISNGDLTHAPDGNSVFDALALKAPLTSPSFTTPVLGTPASGALDNCTSNTESDNNSTTQLATTAFAKSQDAVLARLPDQAVNMTAAASGSSGITVADNDNIDFGTGNFGLLFNGSIPSWVASAILLQKLTGGVGYQLETVVTTGYLKLTLNALTFTTTIAPSFVAGTSHEIVVTVSVGTAQTTVSFYVDGILLETLAAQNNTTTVSNAALLYILGTNAVRTAGTCSFAATYNRALTAVGVLDLYRNGIAFADKWGSQTAIYTSDFSAGVDSWTNGGGAPTITGNIDSIGGQDNNLRITVGSTSQAYATQKSITAVNDKKYRFSLQYYIPSANSNVNGLIVKDAAGAGVTIGGQQSTLDAWTTCTAEFVSGSASAVTLRVNATQGGSTTITDAGGNDVFYLRNVLIYEIGCTLALEPFGIQKDKCYDSSTNALHASYPAAGSSLTRMLNYTIFPTAANNAAAAAAGVPVGGLYRTNADPSVLCTRTA